MAHARPVLIIVVNVPEFLLSHRLPVAVAAREAGYDVHIAASPSEAVMRIEKLGFTFHPIRMRRGRTNPLDELFGFWDILQLFRRLHPRLVHLITIKPVVFGGIAARLAKVPAVVSAIAGLGYVFDRGDVKAAILRTVLKPLFRLALAQKRGTVIFQNESDRSALVQLAGLDRARTRLIKGSGVQLADFPSRPEPPPPLTAVFASRLLWTKGVSEFINAARVVRKELPDARFLMAGSLDEGNPTSLNDADLAALTAENVVTVLGHVTDIPALFARSHVIVYPSFYGEGVPKVLLEAAASARPIVTTNHPGCRDVVEHEVTGLLVPVRDAQALAAAILRLFCEPETRQRMGDAAGKMAHREFSIEGVAARHLEIYAEVSGPVQYRSESAGSLV